MFLYCQFQQYCQTTYKEATEGYKPVVSELIGTAKIGYGVMKLADSVAQDQVFSHQGNTTPEDIQKHEKIIEDMREYALKNVVEGGQQLLPVIQSLLPLCRRIR